MTIAGGVAVAQRIVEILKINGRLYKLDNNREMPVKSAARLVQNLLFSNREVGMPLPLQALIGGFDETGPHVYNLDPFGSLSEENMVSTGSGSPFAYGVLEAEFKENNKVKKMLPVVVRAVYSAMQRDVASGDSFDIAVINADGFRELSPEEKKSLLKS
jgi:proteasome beta subunit